MEGKITIFGKVGCEIDPDNTEDCHWFGQCYCIVFKAEELPACPLG